MKIALSPIVRSFRQIDVHYSLPRDDQKGQDREKNQVWSSVIIFICIVIRRPHSNSKELFKLRFEVHRQANLLMMVRFEENSNNLEM